MHRRPLALLALIVGALLLGACASGGPSTSTSPSTSLTAGPDVTLLPDESPTATVALPSDCAQVGSSTTRAATVDQLDLQSDGADFVRPAPEGAKRVLGCDWFAGDATGYLLLISTTDAATADAYVATLPGLGWTCGVGADDGDMCTMTTANSQYPVDTVETIVSRGGVWIYQSASNIDGQALLSDLQSSIWQS